MVKIVTRLGIKDQIIFGIVVAKEYVFVVKAAVSQRAMKSTKVNIS